MISSSQTVRARLEDLSRVAFVRRADLLQRGISGRAITEAVRAGRLLRVRRGIYALPDTAEQLVAAVRVGGRISCLSLLQMIGVFVHLNACLHVDVPVDLSRSRCRRPDGARLHWSADSKTSGDGHLASIEDAVRQSVRCQPPRAAIATLDSVIHHQLMTLDEVRSMVHGLPARFGVMVLFVDGSAESGPESYMKLILRSLGVSFETQVWIPGVGRVDFVIEGWLIIECDSRAFHEGWEQQARDRERDIAAAALGFVTIRPVAADILERPSDVRARILAVIEALAPRVAGSARSQLRRSAGEEAAGRSQARLLLGFPELRTRARALLSQRRAAKPLISRAAGSESLISVPWPWSGITSSSAPGIASMIARHQLMGARGSSSPRSTSTG